MKVTTFGPARQAIRQTARYINREYGNISNFLNDARLFHSTKLLTEHPEMPIAEVALASGFSNRVVFSRNFKERFAMTPSEFREKN